MADNLQIPAPPWYKRKWILIGLVAMVLAGGAGAVLLLMPPAEEAEQETVVVDDRSLYVGMSRPFIFSVAAGPRDRLVQIDVQLQVRGLDNETLAKAHLPLLESTLLTVFSRQKAETFLAAQGKEAIRQEALQELNHTLTEVVGRGLVEKVLFTGIVMQ